VRTIWYWPNGLATESERSMKFIVEAHHYPEPNKIEVPEDMSWKKIRKAVNMAIAEDSQDAAERFGGEQITEVWIDD